MQNFRIGVIVHCFIIHSFDLCTFQDPRLLGEIHIALLKSIIKDIEDVARTPAVSLGANQSSAANPVGGHPHIVEGVSYSFYITASHFLCECFLISSWLGLRVGLRYTKLANAPQSIDMARSATAVCPVCWLRASLKEKEC